MTELTEGRLSDTWSRARQRENAIGSYKASLALALAIFATQISPSAAYEQPTGQGFFNGNQMLEVCHRRGDDAAMYYAIAIAEITANFPNSTACVPKQVTAQQVRDIFCKFIEDHPERRHEGAFTLGLYSFSTAFPCE